MSREHDEILESLDRIEETITTWDKYLGALQLFTRLMMAGSIIVIGFALYRAFSGLTG